MLWALKLIYLVGALCFTFAGANKEVAVRGDSTEGQIHNRPGVTGAGERRLSHRHGSFGQEGNGDLKQFAT